jgi:hypothetical protein
VCELRASQRSLTTVPRACILRSAHSLSSHSTSGWTAKRTSCSSKRNTTRRGEWTPAHVGTGDLEVSSLTPASCTRAQVLSYVSTQRDFLSGKPNKD